MNALYDVNAKINASSYQVHLQISLSDVWSLNRFMGVLNIRDLSW